MTFRQHPIWQSNWAYFNNWILSFKAWKYKPKSMRSSAILLQVELPKNSDAKNVYIWNVQPIFFNASVLKDTTDFPKSLAQWISLFLVKRRWDDNFQHYLSKKRTGQYLYAPCKLSHKVKSLSDSYCPLSKPSRMTFPKERSSIILKNSSVIFCWTQITRR